MTSEHEFQLLQRSFYEDILNSIPSDIVVLDTDGHYIFLNPVAIKDPEMRNWLVGKTDEAYFTRKGKDLERHDERLVI